MRAFNNSAFSSSLYLLTVRKYLLLGKKKVANKNKTGSVEEKEGGGWVGQEEEGKKIPQKKPSVIAGIVFPLAPRSSATEQEQ